MAGKTEVSAKASAGGVGFTGLLTIAFIVLKLVGVINWSWIWVLSPLWISFALFILVLLVILLPIAIFNKRNR
jgi:membrane protein YdbS with pleckstrin-like domain